MLGLRAPRTVNFEGPVALHFLQKPWQILHKLSQKQHFLKGNKYQEIAPKLSWTKTLKNRIFSFYLGCLLSTLWLIFYVGQLSRDHSIEWKVLSSYIFIELWSSIDNAIGQGIRSFLQRSPDVSPKFWRLVGSFKSWLLCAKLKPRSIAFQRCIS